MRAEWAGVGVNLRTGTPTPDAIRAAVAPGARRPGLPLSARWHSPRSIRSYDTFDVIEAELEAASIVAALRLESPVG